mmetsp:Transcript_26856/g.38348  ORF Transcript_26856/g.38348 Transcript_26856/m.38348 type:complete len:89 (+) Transcript_26856:111-377(+)
MYRVQENFFQATSNLSSITISNDKIIGPFVVNTHFSTNYKLSEKCNWFFVALFVHQKLFAWDISLLYSINNFHLHCWMEFQVLMKQIN